MATYNGAKYIKEQVDSILNQDLTKYPDAELELVVSDDLSTDDTVKILESYNDSRIKIYHHTDKDKHRHKYVRPFFLCTANFGHAMSKATGDYVFLSDQDDVWLPLKVSKTLDLLQENKGVAATAFDVVSDKLKKFGSVEYHKELRWRLNRKNKIYGFSCGFTRRELELFLPMPDIPHHDNFITLMAAFRGKLSFTSEHLALYRYTGVHNVTSIPYDFRFSSATTIGRKW